MKRSLLSLLILFSVPCFADQNAITDTGEEVILKDDGTWGYRSGKSSNSASTTGKIKTNSKEFSKPGSSTFLIKSNKNDTAVWIDPKKWTFKKSDPTKATEYKLRLKEKSLYGMMITEEIELPLKTISNAALTNAQRAAPNAKIIKREYRKVNGIKVLYQEITGTIQKVSFTYISYNFSNKSGSTQLVTYTANNLVNKYRPEIFKLLNGLVTQ
ncbi:MAG: hypothetical protein OEY78_08630 [Gammaproteobacteria bacterium]|nr:hypothetical protein [Gammaproteobacteria bacterium]